MPELPEVETTVTGLNQKVLNRTFIDIWSDWPKMVKKPDSFDAFKKELIGKKIKKIWRRAKNCIFELSDGYSLLVHMKMTGHLMVGRWIQDGTAWKPEQPGPLEERINTYIHFLLTLDDRTMIALSDLRKFAKAELWKTGELRKELEKLGPEPMEADFSLERFKKVFEKKRGKVKQVLMVPEVIVGIGNIYSSEALWWANIHPEKDVSKLSSKELKDLYEAVKKVLAMGIELGGESFADYRNIDGEKGHFYQQRKVYKREQQPCERCQTPIVRKKFGGRSAFFCPTCQKL